METMVIINPHAGCGNRRSLHGFIPSEFRTPGTRIAGSESRKEALLLARDAIAAGARTIVVAGGDGSINSILPAVAGSGAALAVIPTGSANDFARCHGIHCTVPAASWLDASRTTRTVDILRVNGIPFATTGGIGFACDVAFRANGISARHGLLRRVPGFRRSGVYVAALLDALRMVPGRHTEMLLTAEGFTYGGDFLWLLASNQACLGGRFMVAPGAKPDDGMLDICIARNLTSRFQILRLAHKVTRGSHVSSPAIRMGRARCVRIAVDRRVSFFGDGEPLVESDTFDIEVVPKALKVVASSGRKQT